MLEAHRSCVTNLQQLSGIKQVFLQHLLRQTPHRAVKLVCCLAAFDPPGRTHRRRTFISFHQADGASASRGSYDHLPYLFKTELSWQNATSLQENGREMYLSTTAAQLGKFPALLTLPVSPRWLGRPGTRSQNLQRKPSPRS